MKKALKAASVPFNASASADELKALCIANGIAMDDEESVAEPTAAADEKVEEVLVMGQTLRPRKPTDETIGGYIAKKAQKEFPNFIGKLAEGHYTTSGLCDIFTWQRPDEDDVELLVVFLKNDKGELCPVGSWDICSRTLTVQLEDGTEIHPKWVEPTRYTSNSERDRLAANLPEGIDVVLKSGIGHWHNPLKDATRNFSISWLELADEK